MGHAVSDGAGALRALLSATRTAAQEADRLGGEAAYPASPPLAARQATRGGRRQCLRRLGVPGRRQLPPCDLHHAPAARRGPLRSGAAPPARSDWAPPHERQAPGEPVGRAGQPGHRVAARHRAGETAQPFAPGWYGGGERDIEISTNTAVWRHGGMPVVPMRWVLVRDPASQFDPQALLCTDPAQHPVQVLRWFVQRWQVEVMAKPEVCAGSEKCATTLAWKRSASGPTKPSPARHPACSACSLLSPCLERSSRPKPAGPQPTALGITNSARPSPTPSPPCAGKSGANRVSPRPAAQPI